MKSSPRNLAVAGPEVAERDRPYLAEVSSETAVATLEPLPAAATSVAVPASQPLVPRLAAKAERLANVERLRILAMLEIVRFHDHDDRLPFVGGLGLPTFLLLTNLFNCTLTERRGLNKFLSDKRERLFLPWVVWSLVYGAMLIISALRHHEPIDGVLSWNMILAGTSAHLWFVPFALFSAGLVAGTQYLTRQLPDRPIAYLAATLGAVLLVATGLAPEHDYVAPIPQWMLSMPSAFFGFALGRLALTNDGKLHPRDLLPLSVVALAFALYFGLREPNMLIWRYSVSLLLVFAAFLRPGSHDTISRFMSPLLFGIYLAHHFLADRFLVKVPGLHSSQLFFVVDFVCTALVVRALKRTPLKRFV